MRNTGKKGLSNAAIGLILAVVLVVGSYVAFTKKVPWGGGTEYQVVFNSAQNLRVNSPVRIAGVEVGKVTSITPLPSGTDPETVQSSDGSEAAGEGPLTQGALVKLEIQDAGLPLKEDATFKLRPRLFLEGNLFVEVQPGSPGAPPADPEQAFSPAQTSNTVQLDQILTGTFQADARQDLQVFLDQFGKALIEGGGAESFRTLYKSSAGSFRSTSQVNEALLGENPHDLSGLIRNLDKVVNGLGRDELALQDTVTNLSTVAGSFAAQDEALEQAIVELPQVIEAGNTAFASLNEAFPPVRALAREILPGVRSTPSMLDEATPLLEQIRLLSRPEELRGLVADLRPAVPNLALLSRRTVPFLEENRALASCFNEVILPWSLDEVDGGAGYNAIHPPAGDVYQETAYGLAGIAGESRSGDANGQYIRIVGGGGTNTVSVTNPAGETLSGVTQFPIEGTMPSVESSAKTPFEPEEPCENQETPDLRGQPGPVPTQTSVSAEAAPTNPEAAEIFSDSTSIVEQLAEAAELRADGDKQAARPVQREALEDLNDFYEGN
jgi:phospholipid/cholesterol/gamma-HCH transport system substrate-binding protein